MSSSNGIPIHNARRSSSQADGRRAGQMYRRDSNLSTASFMDDVEMEQNEVFGGPMAESVPTSISSFAHRRNRADSTASFTYYDEEDVEDIEGVEVVPPSDDSAILDDEEDDIPYEEDSSVDLEAGDRIELRRSSSGHSRGSVHDRLLRNDSSRTNGSGTERGQRTNHKIYIISEDLTIVVAGFRTSTIGHALYITICTLTLGLGYLLLRWLPRWKVRLVGRTCPLRNCTWVVLEVSCVKLLFSFLIRLSIYLVSRSTC